jgi:hypothetical protein
LNKNNSCNYAYDLKTRSLVAFNIDFLEEEKIPKFIPATVTEAKTDGRRGPG